MFFIIKRLSIHNLKNTLKCGESKLSSEAEPIRLLRELGRSRFFKKLGVGTVPKFAL